jgi:hypothetical protein
MWQGRWPVEIHPAWAKRKSLVRPRGGVWWKPEMKHGIERTAKRFKLVALGELVPSSEAQYPSEGHESRRRFRAKFHEPYPGRSPGLRGAIWRWR